MFFKIWSKFDTDTFPSNISGSNNICVSENYPWKIFLIYQSGIYILWQKLIWQKIAICKCEKMLKKAMGKIWPFWYPPAIFISYFCVQVTKFCNTFYNFFAISTFARVNKYHSVLLPLPIWHSHKVLVDSACSLF